MKGTFNILVTGCGGDISQSIGKVLKDYSRKNKIIGCDIHNEHAGHFIFDRCFTVERASSPLYLSSIEKLIKAEKIDVLIPVTEYELSFFLTNDLTIHDCIVIRPDNFSIEIGLDKFSTSNFLKEKNLPFPKTVLANEVDHPPLPCIIKNRTGSGSKSVHLVKNEETFHLLAKLLGNAVCQEYLEDNDGEYTCGLFRSNSGLIRSIIFRRKLSGGYSGFGEVEINDDITKLLEELAKALNLIGSINVQLRVQGKVPKIFEINPRFSSTVLCRHLLGFQDVIWCLEDNLGFSITDYIAPAKGSKFYKGFQEYIIRM